MAVILKRSATAFGGREGTITTPEKTLELTMAKPKEMDGDGKGTNPEELFAAGYASCFASSIEFLLHKAKKSYEDIHVKAEAVLKTDGDAGFKFALEIEVQIQGLDKDEQVRFTEQASQFCPFSKAVQGNVDIDINVL